MIIHLYIDIFETLHTWAEADSPLEKASLASDIIVVFVFSQSPQEEK